MLYDRLDNLEQYTGLFENLDTCIEWILENGLDELPLGRTVIQGDEIFVDVMECPARDDAEADFETHSKYMDLQIVLDGSQLFQVALEDIEETKPYDEENDYALYKGTPSCAGVLDPERFAVFMVEEAHKGNIRTADCEKSVKAVFKIAR